MKAWPHPSAKYGETVCCAGVTRLGEWRRLFPIRYRHLEGHAQFQPWDIVEYRPELPIGDPRLESRRVHESSLRVVSKIPERERAGFFGSLFRASASEAASRGETLTLVRPRSVEFKWKRRSTEDLHDEAVKRAKSLAQGSLFDKELARIEPCPFDLRLEFDDDDGHHNMGCGDWETGAAFFNLRGRYGEERALQHLKETYESQYVERGVALALGTVAARPQQWLLLGIIRLNETDQPDLLSP